ncbi:hypothetical protein ACP4OV_012689 [Aristida adscensionis]
MGSDRLLSSSVQGLISGQTSRGYTCTEKYEWKNLALHHSEKAAGGQPHRVSTLKFPLHISSRKRREDSSIASEISFPSRGCFDSHEIAETVNNRSTCGVKRLGEHTASHDHGHSCEHCGLVKEVGGPCHLSCSYCGYHGQVQANGVGGPCHLSLSSGGYHGQGQASLTHSSKRFRSSISPGPIRSHWERTPSFDLRHDAKGADRQIFQEVCFRKNFPDNHGSGSHNTHYHEDRYDFPACHFSEIDAAKHQAYLRNFCDYSRHKGHSWEDRIGNISDGTSHGQLHQRDDDVLRAHSTRPVHEFRAVHHGQLEFSPKKDIHEHMDRRRSCRNAYNGMMSKKKHTKQWAFRSTDNGGCANKYGTKSSHKRNTYQLGKKARKTFTYEDKSKRFCCPNEQDQQSQVELNKTRNDSREGNTGITKRCQNDAKGNLNAVKNARTTPPPNISTKCDDNSKMLSPKYCSKTVALSNGPKLSDGSNNMESESEKPSNVDGCIGRSILQHRSVTPMGKVVHQKESSQSEVIRDCLKIWRRLRKDCSAEADKIIKTDQQKTLKASRVSVGGRVTNGSAVAFSSSESDDKDDSALESSEQSSTAMLTEVLKKSGEDGKLGCPLKCPSSNKCNKSPQNTTAEKTLVCNLELPPEANSNEIAQQEKQENLLCCQLSTDHPDGRMQTTQNDCSGISKVDQAVSYQNVCQQEADIINLGGRRKDKLGVRCEIKKKVEGGSANLVEQNISFYTSSTLLDQKTVACFMHDNSKANASEFIADHHGSATIEVSILDRRTRTKCEKKPINRSGGGYCRDVKNGLNRDDCRDIHQGTENCPLLPDLNCLPSDFIDEDSIAPGELVCQVTSDDFKPQSVTKSLSGSLTLPVIKDEEFKQAETNQLIREDCRKGTSESANPLQMSDSNTGPPQVSTVEESSTSSDAFKLALFDFMRNILKPLWEDGLLSRDIFKLIMNKAAAKVINALGIKVPSTNLEISKFISCPDESKNLQKLVQRYLDVYVGREVLKRNIPGSLSSPAK